MAISQAGEISGILHLNSLLVMGFNPQCKSKDQHCQIAILSFWKDCWDKVKDEQSFSTLVDSFISVCANSTNNTAPPY